MKYKTLISILTSGIAFLLFLLLIGESLFQIRLYHLDSMSMRPFLKEGSLLLCKKENFELLNEGDVITYKTENTYVTSRITKINNKEQQIFVKMDIQDEMNLINYTQYKGTLLFSIPYLGMILYFFKGSIGKLICFVILFFILVKIGLIILDKKKKRMLI